jgi:hypothetical protein
LIECESCGQFRIDPIGLNDLKHTLNDPAAHKRTLQRRKAVLAFALRRMDQSAPPPLLDRSTIDRIVTEDRLPTISEQRDNLLRFLDRETEPDDYYQITFDHVGSVVGAESEGAFNLLVTGMVERRLLMGGPGQIALGFAGLERIEELRSASPSGFNAFIAMQYGDPELDQLVEGFFKPAVRSTGFELYRLDDRPKACLIDARLRNEIRQSRFLVVDETHANHGAYWEAGYAEGLGKPVIYTCERSVFDGRGSAQRPHFDTNHHTTVIWDRGGFAHAAEELKQVIRFTISEAKQTD